MKKFIFILFCLFSIGLTACNNDDITSNGKPNIDAPNNNDEKDDDVTNDDGINIGGEYDDDYNWGEPVE